MQERLQEIPDGVRCVFSLGFGGDLGNYRMSEDDITGCSHKAPHFLAQACGIASDAPCSKSDEFLFSHVLHAVYHRDAFGFSRNAPTRMCRGINHDDLVGL